MCGVKFFIRIDRKVILSLEREHYHWGAHKGVNILVNSIEELAELKLNKVLRIVVVPLFSTDWLMPDLIDFSQSSRCAAKTCISEYIATCLLNLTAFTVA